MNFTNSTKKIIVFSSSIQPCYFSIFGNDSNLDFYSDFLIYLNFECLLSIAEFTKTWQFHTVFYYDLCEERKQLNL